MSCTCGIHGSISSTYNGATNSLRSVLTKNNTEEEFYQSIQHQLSSMGVLLKNVLSISIHNEENSTVAEHIPGELFSMFPNLDSLNIYSEIIKGITANDSTKAANLTALTISKSKRLRKLSEGTFRPMKLKYLDLTNNEIDVIHSYTFAHLRSLQHLYLSDNKLTTIDRHIFGGLFSLHVLDLSGNEIHTIENGAFTELKRLFILDLTQNKLKVLKYHVFKGLNNLVTLKLGSNEIKGFENSLYPLIRLENLSLHNNSIDNDELLKFVQLPNVQKLSLFKSGVTLRSFNITSVAPPLKSLNLAFNNLTNAADLEELKVFPNLQELDVRRNKQLNILDVHRQRLHTFLTKLNFFYV